MKRRIPFKTIFIFILLAGIVFLCTTRPASPRVRGALAHEAYVWQRDWNEAVRDAVSQHGNSFRELILLNAEVTWKGNTPQVVRVPIDYATVKKTYANIGLALRIGPYSGNFSSDDSTANFIASLAASLIGQAQSNSIEVAELQIDFDCASSKLDGYRLWVQAIKRKVSPTPVTITALPSWMRLRAFAKLARSSENYVLQVHSLERPKDFNAPFTLCDPLEAKRAIERAAKIGVPFRVALPTYGYLLAFDSTGKFLSLSAEGGFKKQPIDAQIREARADPIELANLIQTWTTNRPALLRGIIWYRLPTNDDILNWRWPTLAAMLAARSPKESFRAETRRVEPGLVEINLVNDGDLDISSRLVIEVHWPNARLVASDGLRGFETSDESPGKIKFQSKAHRLPAGEKQTIGWLRLSEEREVQVEIKKL
ncbi:MAG: DUF3142 domain-containing protein [Verrucomicrobiota bacterium]